jgi:hypothetical protein
MAMAENEPEPPLFLAETVPDTLLSDAPELAAIGDVRDVVLMMRVYRLGEVVWRGPGPYR